MKRFLILSALAFLAVASPATAANFNLVQPDTGTEFQAPFGGEVIQIPVGQHHLTVLQSNVTTAKTSFVMIPVTASRISLISAVLQNRITGNANTWRLWHLDSNGNTVSEVTNGTATFRFTPPTSGNTGLITGKTATFTPNSSLNNTFTQGHVLAISSAGGATATETNSDVMFTITLKPR